MAMLLQKVQGEGTRHRFCHVAAEAGAARGSPPTAAPPTAAPPTAPTALVLQFTPGPGTALGWSAHYWGLLSILKYQYIGSV